jgi:hypothetical protein
MAAADRHDDNHLYLAARCPPHRGLSLFVRGPGARPEGRRHFGVGPEARTPDCDTKEGPSACPTVRGGRCGTHHVCDAACRGGLRLTYVPARGPAPGHLLCVLAPPRARADVCLSSCRFLPSCTCKTASLPLRFSLPRAAGSGVLVRAWVLPMGATWPALLTAPAVLLCTARCSTVRLSSHMLRAAPALHDGRAGSQCAGLHSASAPVAQRRRRAVLVRSPAEAAPGPRGPAGHRVAPIFYPGPTYGGASPRPGSDRWANRRGAELLSALTASALSPTLLQPESGSEVAVGTGRLRKLYSLHKMNSGPCMTSTSRAGLRRRSRSWGTRPRIGSLTQSTT